MVEIRCCWTSTSKLGFLRIIIIAFHHESLDGFQSVVSMSCQDLKNTSQVHNKKDQLAFIEHLDCARCCASPFVLNG